MTGEFSVDITQPDRQSFKFSSSQFIKMQAPRLEGKLCHLIKVPDNRCVAILFAVLYPFSDHWQSWLNSAINFSPFNAYNNSYDTLVIIASFSCSL